MASVRTEECNQNCSIVRRASRIVGEELLGVDAVYVRRVRAKLRTFWNDQNHPLHEELASRLIRRSVRLRPLKAPPTRSSEEPYQFIIPIIVAKFFWSTLVSLCNFLCISEYVNFLYGLIYYYLLTYFTKIIGCVIFR